MRLIALTLCAVFLAGCSAAKIGGNDTLPPEKGEGLIVLSTRYDDRCGGAMGSAQLNMEILRGNDITRRTLPVMNPLLKNDFDNPPGFFQMWKLPAGDLRLTEVKRIDIHGSAQSERPVDFQMRIEPGKVYYLGELYLDIQCDIFTLRIKDQRARDAALFDKRMKALKSSQFVYSVIRLR